MSPGRTPLRIRACLLALALAIGAGPAMAGVRNLPPPGVMVPPGAVWAKEFTVIREGRAFHLFYMRHDQFVVADSTENDIGHAVSYDLKNWTQLPAVLHSRPGKWDDLHVWSPSIVKSGGTFYMFYTGVTAVPFSWNSYQRIGVATSTDLTHWTRYDAPVLSGNNVPWVFADSSNFDGCQFRDAFVMPDPTTPGRWLNYYVGVPKSARDQLIGGIAQTTNLLGTWSDLMPLWCTDAAHFWGWCESLHLIQHGSLWYMFATTNSGHVLGFRTAPSPVADSTLWSGKYRLFDMAGQDPISDAWFGSETISADGHDFLAVVNSLGHRVEFYEMIWGTPPNFSLATPNIVLGVDGAATRDGLALSAEGHAKRGSGLLLRASLPQAATARVELFDVTGRRLRTLHDGPLPAGDSAVAWDGHDDAGHAAACGIYFAALTTPDGRRVARVPVVD